MLYHIAALAILARAASIIASPPGSTREGQVPAARLSYNWAEGSGRIYTSPSEPCKAAIHTRLAMILSLPEGGLVRPTVEPGIWASHRTLDSSGLPKRAIMLRLSWIPAVGGEPVHCHKRS